MSSSGRLFTSFLWILPGSIFFPCPRLTSSAPQRGMNFIHLQTVEQEPKFLIVDVLSFFVRSDASYSKNVTLALEY